MDFSVNDLMPKTQYTVIGFECENQVQFIEFVVTTMPYGK